LAKKRLATWLIAKSPRWPMHLRDFCYILSLDRGIDWVEPDLEEGLGQLDRNPTVSVGGLCDALVGAIETEPRQV